MSDIKIEKGIPIPKRRKSRGMNHYPFNELEVGDSFFLPDVEKKFSILGFARDYNLRNHHCPIRVLQRREGNGVRVWRIE